MTQSTLRGVLTVYQYYSPSGADFLIEASSKIDDVLTRMYPEYEYKRLVQLAFAEDNRSLAFRNPARMVDLLGRAGLRSGLFCRPAFRGEA